MSPHPLPGFGVVVLVVGRVVVEVDVLVDVVVVGRVVVVELDEGWRTSSSTSSRTSWRMSSRTSWS